MNKVVLELNKIAGRTTNSIPPLIGVVGGYGGVGQVTAQCIRAWDLGRLRIGGRRLEPARQFVREKLTTEAEFMTVDVADVASLARFCAGCRVIVNCAGPSFEVLDKVACAALAADADYVDPGGGEATYERLKTEAWVAAGRVAILSAGMMPGLTGLLPKWLSEQGFARSRALTVYVCLKDRFTPAAAREYVLSLSNGYGESLAAWRNGRRVSHALQPLTETRLPFFSRPVNAHPYLSTEAERLARALGLIDLSWYNVFEGEHVLATIGRLQALSDEQRASLCSQLVRAAELDLFGQDPSQLFALSLDGEDHNGGRLVRTLLLRARDSYELSGTVAALATMEVLRGTTPPGVRFAMDVLNPLDTVERLRHSAAVTAMELIAEGTEENSALDEGAL